MSPRLRHLPPGLPQHLTPRLRLLSARDVLAGLRKIGFHVVATRGSHAKLRRLAPDGSRQTLTIPPHRELDPGTLQAIFRQASTFIPSEELKPIFFLE